MFDKRGEPIIHVDWYILTKDLKLPANWRNNSQHCWPNIVGSYCVHLRVAKRLTSFKLGATTPDHVQQGVQTDPKMLRPFAWDFLNV